MLLKNDLIYLRFLRRNDARRCFDAIEESRTQLAQFVMGPTGIHSIAQEEEFITKSIRLRREKKLYGFGIFDSQDRSYVGGVGLHSVVPSIESAEIGYWIRTSRAGCGHATMAAALAVSFGFERLKLHRIVLRAAIDNPASQRVAEKLGFVPEGIQRHELKLPRGWVDLKCYSMLESEYAANRKKIEDYCRGK